LDLMWKMPYAISAGKAPEKVKPIEIKLVRKPDIYAEYGVPT
jgi:hypothetical protein